MIHVHSPHCFKNGEYSTYPTKGRGIDESNLNLIEIPLPHAHIKGLDVHLQYYIVCHTIVIGILEFHIIGLSLCSIVTRPSY